MPGGHHGRRGRHGEHLLVDPGRERQQIEDGLKELEHVGVVLVRRLLREASTLVESPNVHVKRLVVPAIQVHAARAREHVPVGGGGRRSEHWHAGGQPGHVSMYPNKMR